MRQRFVSLWDKIGLIEKNKTNEEAFYELDHFWRNYLNFPNISEKQLLQSLCLFILFVLNNTILASVLYHKYRLHEFEFTDENLAPPPMENDAKIKQLIGFDIDSDTLNECKLKFFLSNLLSTKIFLFCSQVWSIFKWNCWNCSSSSSNPHRETTFKIYWKMSISIFSTNVGNFSLFFFFCSFPSLLVFISPSSLSK